MKIAIIDTAYPAFLDTLPPLNGSYDEELRRYLERGFGTSDFYSHNLKAEGWECIDIIGNHRLLQTAWAREHGWCGQGTPSLQSFVLEQLREFRPDVVFMQDLSFFSAADLQMLSGAYLLVGQCSCPMPRQENVSKFAVLFTSFPHYVEKFKALGVHAEYLPLAFDPRMLELEGGQKRQFDISFVGGLGRNSHWKAGTDVIEKVAEVFRERFVWFGYGRENIPLNSPLHACYAGPAWGREMYGVYARSKIVINRHGEVAEGYANNLRMYEATGMGALLFTENASNLRDLFRLDSIAEYSGADQLIARMNNALSNWTIAARSAEYGQKHTLENHTYAHRMKRVSEVLTEKLVAA